MTVNTKNSTQNLADMGDAEQHYQILLKQLREAYPEGAPLSVAGIHSGGVWLAKRLVKDLGLTEVGMVNVAFHRDDYAKKGLHTQAGPSSLPKNWHEKPLLLVDDVMYTGRTVRAALNELFDYGRPSKVELAVLADRGGRELPIEPQYRGAKLVVPNTYSLVLKREELTDQLSWQLEQRTPQETTISTSSTSI